MKKSLSILVLSGMLAVSLPSCDKEYGNLNSPTIEEYLNNASVDQLSGLVAGTVSGMRNNLAAYLDAVGVMGREIYRFSSADPRFVTELLGADNTELNNTGFYLTNPWASRYRVVKNCNVLIQAALNSQRITDEQRKAFIGFAKTIKAHELLMNLNLTYNNGIRVDVADPENLGPFLGYTQSLDAIAALLDEGRTDLLGSDVAFDLTEGFEGFNDADGLIQFNRALAARVSIYQGNWNGALTNLNGSFFDLNGSFDLGISHEFSTNSGDQLNPAFFEQNSTGEVRLAHPSFATDITPGDDRIAKATLRDQVASNTGLSSNRDVWVYQSSTAPIPIIRNEELILIYAEAKIRLSQFPDAIVALNRIRVSHNLGVYAGAVTENALTDDMLRQRRYSLYYEGHRWIDVRRYNRLATLPIDRPNDDVWTEMPIPQTENQ